ncbi:UvrD-helicase domain-containing protein [Xanthomonas arboricola]|uniref:UvrD-helicase domain-containing protein n=1 Tax=Xanthomonas arboricola TaxID=56448 RepID=UPI004040B98A
MTDLDVATALRSDAPLVVIEAPAGCGKTYQAADYARWLGGQLPSRRVLILTHTHAACDVFRARAPADSRRLHICTFDGFITQVATIYHRSLGLPQDVARWAIEQHQEGFAALGEHVSQLLLRSQAVRSAIALRYPIVVCDEHQDTNAAQHRIALQLLDSGAKLRVFGDPRQAIYGTSNAERAAHRARWQALRERADRYERLEFPHRWAEGSRALGDWVLEARAALEAGTPIDVRGNLPRGLRILRANNDGHRGQFRLDAESATVHELVRQSDSLLVLAPTQELVGSLHAFFGRTVRIWEGHSREALRRLAQTCVDNLGNAPVLAAAACDFVQDVTTGFTAQRRQQCLQEVDDGARRARRLIPGEMQAIARCILQSPDHVGIARALQRLILASTPQGILDSIKIDHHRELREASQLDQFIDAIQGQTELTRRRTYAGSSMPNRVISTIHKAKGLERRDVVIMPCDASTFSGTDYKRCVAYVALSRATQSLTLVVSPTRPPPIFLLQ